MLQKGTITTYESGADLVVEWKIEDFFNPSRWDPLFYCSPDFAFGGEKWWLEIYPVGSSRSDSSEHVDLRLLKYDSGRSIEQSFSLSLKTVTGEKYNEQRVTNDFDDYNGFREFNRFIHRTELSRRRSDLGVDGNLTVICTMKNTTLARSDRDEVPTAEVNTSGMAGSATSAASGSSQAGPNTTKESVLKCIEENYKEASKGRKRKMEEENNNGSLCQDFKKLLLEGLNHDLILKVGDKELRAHRDVLRARSQVFKSMLDHDMKEKNSGIIDIPDCDPLAMEQFLFYIYSGNVETLDQSNMLNLYYIADKYEMKGLKKECSDFIRESLSQANICEVIQLAMNHSDSSLLKSATVYFRNNMLGILHTVEWQVFMKENFTVANELLIKAVESLSNVKT